MKRSTFGLLFACAGVACARSPDPRLYTLPVTAGARVSDAPAIIELMRPSIAGYLDRPGIVREITEQRLEASEKDRWAEPLAEMVSRVLAQDLAARLPNTQVFTEVGTVRALPGARVQVDLVRFQRAGDEVILVASVGIARGDAGSGAVIERVELRAAADGDTSAVVAAMGKLLGELADRVAARLGARSAGAE